MKKVVFVFALMICLLTMVGCTATKTLHCDNCDKEVKVKKDSNMEESWVVYCDECNEDLFGDNPLLNVK